MVRGRKEWNRYNPLAVNFLPKPLLRFTNLLSPIIAFSDGRLADKRPLRMPIVPPASKHTKSFNPTINLMTRDHSLTQSGNQARKELRHRMDPIMEAALARGRTDGERGNACCREAVGDHL